MARRYDSRTTIFSPEGRLYQVEYAMEAISHSGAAVGLLAGTNGAVLAAEKRITSKGVHKEVEGGIPGMAGNGLGGTRVVADRGATLPYELLQLLDTAKSSERLYKIDDHVGVAVAGITADANILINSCRLSAQRYRFQYQESMPLVQLVQQICDQKQGYTQFGGLRPFGVSFLFAGWDKHFGMQLYHSNPSGNYAGWKATAIGANNQSAQSILKTDFKEDMTTDEAMKLAIKVLGKTMDSTTLTTEKVEMVKITADASGKMDYHVCTAAELEPLLKEANTASTTGEGNA